MSEKHRQAFSHGGDVALYTHRKKTILDFSANTSPLGLPFAGRLALISCCAGISQYPDPYCRKLISAISLREQISDSHIVCGNGATELIYAAAHAVKPRRALIVEPAFSEYRRALLITGCSESAIESFMLTADTEFSLTEELCAELCHRLTGIDMLFVCSPSNPAGTVIPFALLERIAAERDNFKVVTLEQNGGLFNARIAGAAQATGEYIAFMDSDDIVTKNWISSLVRKAENAKADLVFSDIKMKSEKKLGGSAYCNLEPLHMRDIDMNGGEMLEEMMRMHGLCVHYQAIWGKLIRRDLWCSCLYELKNLAIKTSRYMAGEDVAISATLFTIL